MKLKEKGNIFLYFYRILKCNSDVYPKSICQLFWGGILGFIMFLLTPIITLYVLYHKLRNPKIAFLIHYDAETSESVFYNFAYQTLIVALYALGVAGVSDIFYDVTYIPLWIWLIGWLLPFVAVLAIVIITVFIVIQIDNHKVRRKRRSENIDVIRAGTKSFWNKICPIIEWE